MSREDFIKKLNERLRLVRTEYDLTQEEMAHVVGISKKTLVEIEKGRSSLGWTGAVAICSIFSGSEILEAAFGGETSDVIEALAFSGSRTYYPKTMGGKIWWRTVETVGKYRIQQNIISHHYRALDDEDCRVCAAFELEKIKLTLENFMI